MNILVSYNQRMSRFGELTRSVSYLIPNQLQTSNPNAKAETSCGYRDPVLLQKFASNVSIYHWVHRHDVRAAPEEGTPRQGTQSPKK